MRNVKIIIAYEGTAYQGWQIQAGGPTIQGELTRVLSLLDHRDVTVHGAGRTDAGVHAEGQVASFLLERDDDMDRLRDAINGNLPRDIRVLGAEVVADDFHARFSARGKTYLYRIWNGEVVSPFVRRYVHHHRGPLDLEAMREAARALVGRHDFRAFTVADAEVRDHVRTLTRLEVGRSGDEIHIVAEADGFLRYMVRTIVGTLLEVGRGRQEAAGVEEVLAQGRREMAGPTAPAAGLTLLKVAY